MDYFVLEQKSPGLVITHPYSTFSLALDFPSVSQSLTDAQDAKARFCYQVIPVPGQTALQSLTDNALPPTFTIVETPNIEVSLRGGLPLITSFKYVYKTQQYLLPFNIYEALDITSVPAQGPDIVFQPGWQDATKIKFIRNIIDDQSYTMYWMMISCIPIVGMSSI